MYCLEAFGLPNIYMENGRYSSKDFRNHSFYFFFPISNSFQGEAFIQVRLTVHQSLNQQNFKTLERGTSQENEQIQNGFIPRRLIMKRTSRIRIWRQSKIGSITQRLSYTHYTTPAEVRKWTPAATWKRFQGQGLKPKPFSWEPTVQHGELCLIHCNDLYGKRI